VKRLTEGHVNDMLNMSLDGAVEALAITTRVLLGKRAFAKVTRRTRLCV
jgi:hypothetical protein